MPPPKTFVMETKDPSKSIVTSPFKVKDNKQPISLGDIQSLVEQNNYTNKYLQTLGNHILKDMPQIGESSKVKALEKPLFKPHEIPLEKLKALNRPYHAELANKAKITKMNEKSRFLGEV